MIAGRLDLATLASAFPAFKNKTNCVFNAYFWGSGIRQNSENKGNSGEFHYVQPEGLELRTL
jgi:hypothetical protein